jgi:hypothetical protein
MRSTAMLLLPNHPPIAVRTTDISAAGLGLVASANPPERLIVQLRLQIPQRPAGYKAVDVVGKVMNSVYSRRDDGFRIGLLFQNPSPQAMTVIVDYLNK